MLIKSSKTVTFDVLKRIIEVSSRVRIVVEALEV